MRSDKQILFWLSAALLLILAVLLLKAILLPFVAGIVIAYFLNPIADRLDSWGLGRVGASVLIVLAVGVVVVAALVFLLPLLAAQLQQLAATMPGEAMRLKGIVETWVREHYAGTFPQLEAGIDNATQELAKNWASWAGIIARSIWDQSLALFNFVSLMLVTPLVVFYLLVDWHRMIDAIDGWLPREHAPTVRRLAGEVNDAVSAFIRGQGTVCLILGTFYALALTAVGLKYGLLIGLTTGLLAFVPFVGWALGILTATGLAVVQYWPDLIPIAKVVAVFLAGQALDASLLSPKIVGSKIGLHPVWLLFALFVFSYLFGFVGMLVAVPVAAATAVVVRFALRVYLESDVYAGRAPVIADIAPRQEPE